MKVHIKCKFVSITYGSTRVNLGHSIVLLIGSVVTITFLDTTVQISVRPKQIFYRNTENRNRPFGKTEIRPKPNILPKECCFCRKSIVSAERVLFLPKESCFCQYGLLSTEILLYRPKQACFCQSREHTWPIKYYYYYIHERQNI